MSQKQASNTSDEQDGKSFWEKTQGILTAIAAVLTAIGGVVAALSAAGLIPSLASIIAPPTTTLASPASTSIPPISTLIQSTATVVVPTIPPVPLLPTEIANWTMQWTFPFDPEFWSEGSHSYTLVQNCPNALPAVAKNSGKITFQVSKQTSLVPGDVYLTENGLIGFTQANNSIHPSQRTQANISIFSLTHSDANFLEKDCRGSITWDDKPPRTLIPLGPWQ